MWPLRNVDPNCTQTIGKSENIAWCTSHGLEWPGACVLCDIKYSFEYDNIHYSVIMKDSVGMR